MTEHDIYRFYNEKVKIIYAEVEARDNTLPVELLFEIHAAFDHLKRIHIDGEAEMAACEKAYSHLKRGLLDAFKLKLKYHNKEYELLTQKKGSLRLIDSGQYLPALLSARKELVNTAKRARINEVSKKATTRSMTGIRFRFKSMKSKRFFSSREKSNGQINRL